MEFVTPKISLTKINEIGDSLLHGNDLEFFKRVWSADFDLYSERLKAIGFYGKDRVLDAGCGCGQWSVVLAHNNARVDALDCSEIRVSALQSIAELHDLGNIETHCGTIEDLPFEDETFDAIFSYSTIYFTDVRKTLKEFARVLNRGAELYISTNGLGWYLHNLIDGHNESATFDSRKMAINTINESLNYYSLDSANNTQIITPSKFIRRLLMQFGFEIVATKPDGKIILKNDAKPVSFYPETYYGLEGVYEIIAVKK